MVGKFLFGLMALMAFSTATLLVAGLSMLIQPKLKKWYIWVGGLLIALFVGGGVGFVVGLHFEAGQKIGLARMIIELPKRLQSRLQHTPITSRAITNQLSMRILEARLIQNSCRQFASELGNNPSINDHIIFCKPEDNLQQKVNEAEGKELRLLPGTHISYVTDIPSNTTIYIPQNATIKLADDIDLSGFFKGSPKGDAAVIRCTGTEAAPLENIKIILNGTIDGNKENHPYSAGGFEGIAFKWVKNSTIKGVGVVKNANGDGIDVDAVSKCYFEGVKLINNEGTGFHFGSPRPIRPSKRNVAVGLYAEGNGFERIRNGFDHSWPNNGVIYIGCIAKDNYRNWQIDGEGGMVLASRSINTGYVVKPDDFDDASFAQVNGQIQVPTNFQTTIARARVYLTKRQTLSAQTWEKIELEGESFDPGSNFDSVTDYDFTVPVSGYYFVIGAIRWHDEGVNDNERYCAAIYVNDNSVINTCDSPVGGRSLPQFTFTVMHLDKNDRVELWAKSYEAGVDKDIYDGKNLTWMTIHLISND